MFFKSLFFKLRKSIQNHVFVLKFIKFSATVALNNEERRGND
jgi:hypothetical protein